MAKDYRFATRGVCARAINITVEGDTIEDVSFYGGCDGNLKAIGKLIAGKKMADIADILEGNKCGNKETSCADQLARALRVIMKEQAGESAAE